MRRNRKALQALEDEVTHLRDEVGSLKAADNEPVSRRHLLRAAGTAVAAGLGLAVADEVLSPAPAGATDAPAPYAASSASGTAALSGTNSGSGYGVSGAVTNVNSSTAAIYGNTIGGGVGVWGEITNTSSINAAVYGVTNTTFTAGAGVWGRASGTGARAIFAENTNVANGQAVIQATHSGTGAGVVAQNNSIDAAVSGGNAGSGAGVRGGSTNGNGVEGTAGAGGVGVSAKSDSGAALRLIPVTSTLPTGSRTVGEVFIDLNGNLFMCKVAGAAPAAWMRVGFNPIDPVRIIDTRLPGLPDKMTQGSELLVSIIGVAGVPAGATAVTLNVTAVDPTANGGFLSLYPATSTYSSGSPPSFSNVNFNAGQTVANSATIKLSPPGTATAGKIKVFNAFGNTDVILDVAGFFS